MKKILIISCVFPPEPVVSAKLSYDLAVELSKVNEVSVLSPKPTRPQDFEFKNQEQRFPFHHIVVPSYTHPQSQIFGRMRESYSFGKYCADFIEKNKNSFDVIYINSWPLFSQYFIVKAAKKNHIPTVIHIQDIYPESLVNRLPFAKKLFFNLLLPLDRYILKNTQHILCISKNMLKTLSEKRKIPTKKFTVVANWQDEENFIEYRDLKKGNESNSGHFRFMYLGNNGPVAGVDLLIKAFVHAALPNSELIIAGSGSRTAACKELAKTLGAGNIKFVPVPDGEVPSVQSSADVMLLPVKTGAAMSSIPSKLPAYMFSEKPIIGSLDLESDTAKAIVDAECGFVVEPENISKLAEAMTEIYQLSSSELHDKGKKGFDYAMENLSKKSNLQKVVNVIMNCSNSI